MRSMKPVIVVLGCAAVFAALSVASRAEGVGAGEPDQETTASTDPTQDGTGGGGDAPAPPDVAGSSTDRGTRPGGNQLPGFGGRSTGQEPMPASGEDGGGGCCG